MSRGCRPMVVCWPSALVAALIAFASSQGMASGVKTWTQTSVEDFSKGTLQDVVITNTSGGELTLPHPMKKVVADHKDNNIPRFVSRDREGRYVQAWTQTDGVYAQRYDADGKPIGETFQVSNIRFEEQGIEVSYNSPSSQAYAVSNPEGGFLVVWDCDVYSRHQQIPHHYRIYGQLYDSQGEPIGDSFRIDEGVGSGSYYPMAFVDKNGAFWVLWSEQFFNPQKALYLYAQRSTRGGQKIEGNFRLIEQDVGHSQMFAAATKVPDGGFAVAWKGEGLLVQYFDDGARALGPPLQIDGLDPDIGRLEGYYQGVRRLDLCFDAQGGFLLTWELLVCPPGSNGYNRIYGQYFKDRLPYRTPFSIKAVASQPDVFSDEDGSFWVSWMEETDIYANGWRWSPVYSGTFVSEAFDTGPAGADFEQIFWTMEEIPETTVVKFKMRSGTDLENLNQSDWYGPESGSEHYTYPGQTISALHNGDRLIQYKTFLSTLDERKTPILYDVSIAYTSRDTVAPAIPGDLAVVPGHSMVTLNWRPSSEADLLEYRLYRRTEEGTYDPTWTRYLSPSQTAYADSSAETGTMYFYAISAVDSSLNESGLSKEVLGVPFSKSWYVDVSSGSEVGDGSALDPFSHIKDALELAVYADTVYVAPGTYTESISIGKGIALLGEGYEVCSILNPEDQDHWWPPVVALSDGATIKGFTVHQRVGRGADAILCGGRSPIISNNKISARSTAISCRDASPIISDNVITTSEFGISSRGGFPLILRNIISGVKLGISIKRGEGLSSLSRIQNNLIYRVSQGIFASWDTDVEIVGNTIYLDKYTNLSGIMKAGGRVKLMNNIIVNKGRGWTVGVNQSSYELSYNDIWGAKRNYVDCEPGEGDISLDPLFVNVDKGDFRLRPDSPCRDAGNPDPDWNDLNGTRNDMGAYGGPDPTRIGTYHPKVTVVVLPASGAAGDTLTVPIQLDNAAGLAEVAAELSYNADLLIPLSARTTELTSEFSLTYHFDVGGTVRITLSGETDIEGGQGAIAEIVFAVPAFVSGGEACPLELKDILLSDGAGVPIEIKSLTDGAFVVIERGPSEKFIYVDQSYAGEEDGSWSRPFDTIGEAMAAASTGDTIQVAAGFYRERITMKEGVFLRGSGPLVSKIYVEDDTLAMAAVTFRNASNGGISGFEIRRKSSRFEGPTLECIASSPLITRNRIVSWEGTGSICSAIYCQGTTAFPARIEDNLIEVNSGGTGIWCNVSDPIVAGNRLLVGVGDFQGMPATGIFCESSDPVIIANQIRLGEEAIGIRCPNASHPIIANNYLEGNSQSHWGIRGSASSSLLVINNIIRGFITAILSDSWSAPSSALIENNIVWDNETGVICDESSSVQLSYNLFWNNGTDYSGCSSGGGDLNTDPMFLDPEVGNFHLREGSPCMDAGDPDPKYNDLDGSRNDMGIYGGPYGDSGERFALPVRLSLRDMSASAGDTLSMPVDVANATGIAEAQMVLTYPSESLSVLDVRTTESSRAFSLTTEYVEEGEVRISMSNPAGIVEERGSLLHISLAVNTSAEVGSESEVMFKEVVLHDDLGAEVAVSDTSTGRVRIALTAVESEGSARTPFRFALSQNYPNPFNPLTSISFTIPSAPLTVHSSAKKVKLAIYNLLGQRVRTLVSGKLDNGEYSMVWDGRDDLGRDVSSGVYLYRLTVAGGRWMETKKMVLVR